MFHSLQLDMPATLGFNAQALLMKDVSNTLSRTFQEMCQLNIQLGQTLLEESAIIGYRLLDANRQRRAIPINATGMDKAAGKTSEAGEQAGRDRHYAANDSRGLSEQDKTSQGSRDALPGLPQDAEEPGAQLHGVDAWDHMSEDIWELFEVKRDFRTLFATAPLSLTS